MYDVAEILGRLDDIRSWQEDLYRHLHAHPELSRQEHATAALVARDLREWGYEVLEHVGGTGVVGVLENGPGRTVLVRADMDALPVREATGLDYASTVTAVDATGATVPVMHACGHDVHVSCLLSAARLLAAARSAWSGTFVALFQPDEELVGGAQAMIDDGWSPPCRVPTWLWPSTCSRSPPARCGPVRVRSCPPPTPCGSP